MNKHTIHERDLVVTVLEDEIIGINKAKDQLTGKTHNLGRKSGIIAQTDNGAIEIIQVRLVL